MFGFKQKREVKRLLDEARGKNQRAVEALDEGRCVQAFDHYVAVVWRYSVARRLMDEFKPSRELANDFALATSEFNQTRSRMNRCLCDK